MLLTRRCIDDSGDDSSGSDSYSNCGDSNGEEPMIEDDEECYKIDQTNLYIECKVFKHDSISCMSIDIDI